jgi:hypothetical protein
MEMLQWSDHEERLNTCWGGTRGREREEHDARSIDRIIARKVVWAASWFPILSLRF